MTTLILLSWSISLVFKNCLDSLRNICYFSFAQQLLMRNTCKNPVPILDNIIDNACFVASFLNVLLVDYN